MNTRDWQEQYGRYSMIIEWSDADHGYIVTVPELPNCTACGATRQEAVRGMQEAIAHWMDTARAKGQLIPQPKTFTYWSPFAQAAKVDAAQDSPAKS
jgi:predicted RNase H-like HicB family nuclease